MASRVSLVGKSKKNVPRVKRRRNSGGRLMIELHVATKASAPATRHR
jgi:hypothetical protein